jgi:CDP-glucose 4,6-dehydratase
MSSQFWQGKKVFMTGHTGFKGSWLSLWLHMLGAKVYGYSLPAPTNPSLFHLARINHCVTGTTGDIRDLHHLTEALIEVQPDIVLHLAAQPLVRESYVQPIDTFTTNVIGTANVLEAVRCVPSVRAVVVVTSDKCYENREWLWGYREDDPMGGHDPYSASKGASELIVASYRRSFFENNADTHAGIASVRAGNVIGGGDFAQDRLIPDFIRAIERKDGITIRNPHAIRPWQFVLEPLGGYLCVAQRLYEAPQEYAEGWNFGPVDTDTQTVSQVCAVFNHALHQHGITPVEITLQTAAHNPHEAGHLRLDISKARQRLDWVPKLDLHTSLEMTAQWYGHYLNHDDVRQVCEQQIDFFRNLQ